MSETKKTKGSNYLKGFLYFALGFIVMSLIIYFLAN